MFAAMEFSDFTLRLLDQRLLPGQIEWLQCRDLGAVCEAIETMAVRGAPAIATSAAYGLVIDAHVAQIEGGIQYWQDYKDRWETAVNRLLQTRPTAVNLQNALKGHRHLVGEWPEELPMAKVVEAFEQFASRLQADDLATCQQIGSHGAELVESPVRVLTHCNTGSLATAGYGTALGVIRRLHEEDKLVHVLVDETRPFLQGSRLTALELRQEGIPFALQVDAAAAFAMKEGKVDMVVVGADRIASNGDTANKIGTYNLAVAAYYHNVPFYVAAPLSTFDFDLKSGQMIPIEQRPASELTEFKRQHVAPEGIEVWNPSFDVTPAELINGIITERGVLTAPYQQSIAGFDL